MITSELSEIPEQMGPCSTHGRMNCLECYDIEPEDLDDDGNFVVVDGEQLIAWNSETARQRVGGTFGS